MKIAICVLFALCAFGLWVGAQPASVVLADEPLVYTAPICCEVKIPNCFCWPSCSDPWPEPPCPTTWLGQPMSLFAAGESEYGSWPDLCAVVDMGQGRGKMTGIGGSEPGGRLQ